uniref:Uncharacterized protein n=1 Tax=Schizaphis graminum TaxID=13262 RepID=A0A2S2PHH6_SCHGA
MIGYIKFILYILIFRFLYFWTSNSKIAFICNFFNLNLFIYLFFLVRLFSYNNNNNNFFFYQRYIFSIFSDFRCLPILYNNASIYKYEKIDNTCFLNLIHPVIILKTYAHDERYRLKDITSALNGHKM